MQRESMSMGRVYAPCTFIWPTEESLDEEFVTPPKMFSLDTLWLRFGRELKRHSSSTGLLQQITEDELIKRARNASPKYYKHGRIMDAELNLHLDKSLWNSFSNPTAALESNSSTCLSTLSLVL
jgi:hypothetical protein